MALTLHSQAFQAGGDIPLKYTCEGHNISPPLDWRGAPEETKSFILIVEDPDAPDPRAPTRTWVHWILYDIPPGVSAIAEGEVPEGAKRGKNDWNRSEYGGPCPPTGRHRYFHRLYALDTKLSNFRTPGKEELEAEMHGHVLAEATLIGTYEKSERSRAR